MDTVDRELLRLRLNWQLEHADPETLARVVADAPPDVIDAVVEFLAEPAPGDDG